MYSMHPYEKGKSLSSVNVPGPISLLYWRFRNFCYTTSYLPLSGLNNTRIQLQLSLPIPLKTDQREVIRKIIMS